LFGSKTELKSVLALWDAYIAEDDPVFFQFVGMAMLEKEAPSLYDADPASLPESLSNFTVTDPKDLWKRARALRDQTPDSFAHRVRSALWRPDPDSKEDNSIFFTLGAEVVRHCYGGATGSWRLFLFDLRSNREFCAGHFPMAVNLPDSDRRNAEEVKREMHDCGWRPDSGLHVVLVPSTNKAGWPLFRCLTRELNVPYVSMVQGGFGAIDKCRSPGMDLIQEETGRGTILNFGGLFSSATRNVSRMTGTAQQMYSVAAGGAAEAIASLRIDAQSDLHTLETIAALDWIQYELSGDSSKFRLLLSQQLIILTRFPPIESSNGPALEEVGRRSILAVHRITSKKEDASMLCFYFEDDVSNPVWVLQFGSKDKAQECISHVRSRYRALKKPGAHD
jgi:hypothetical protein